ncbi:MAG: stage II sporulation protein P [Faecalibacterium sp.]|nr:stage II sporulation protein P [Ruminococcus sp.]MCM1391551.1 stage II sporulation protein P [Ruminococcus sp.]MCM1485486.1 stage II sporulation protein P [Faecalibacterium sp.]
MNKRKNFALKISAVVVLASICVLLTVRFSGQLMRASAKIAVMSAARLLPSAVVTFDDETQTDEKSDTENTTEKEDTTKAKETTTKQSAETTVKASKQSTDDDFYTTPDDIKKMIEQAKKNTKNDKKDGTIYEKQYVNEGVTDKYGSVKVKNTNDTKIDIKQMLSEKVDLSIDKSKPAVLIYHTHTTESYQYIDRNFYATGYVSRNTDESRNMVRVGDAICEQLEKAGFVVLHDKTIHDAKYNGAYERSRATVVEYLKKYPTIQITLDIHRDAIQQTNGVKIKPTATINGKKAAQVMIISGCQEKGNGIENFADWRYNLVFATHLQKEMEETFPGLTRPIFFCPRRYNMNLTHTSLLLEIGSDSNTLEEAYFTGKCIGKSLAQLMAKYVS